MSSDSASLTERVRRLERVMEISRTLSSTLHLEPLLQKIVETAVELTGSEASSILLFDEASGELRFEAVPGTQRDGLKAVSTHCRRWLPRPESPSRMPASSPHCSALMTSWPNSTR
jgi:GAF domain-containing protein